MDERHGGTEMRSTDGDDKRGRRLTVQRRASKETGAGSSRTCGRVAPARHGGTLTAAPSRAREADGRTVGRGSNEPQ
ncbi:hypothetical protein Syun_004006 [Stephania yunnanensis]|uniref:Uncharacterized protein n=1 Tax=Stephania yunnanensis TaxID=152371 RepID=A0AAP0Q250_9MAGN